MTEYDCIQRVKREWSMLPSPKHDFQHTPQEFGALVHFLLNTPSPPKHYLEIGAGKGHAARIFDSFFGFETIRLIDDGAHYSGRLERNPQAMEWIGDSMSQGAVEAIDRWGCRYDLILVDGGHSYECVKSDTFLSLRCLRDSCFIVYHDASHGEVRQWLGELVAGVVPGITHVRQFGRDEPRGHIVNTSLFRWDIP